MPKVDDDNDDDDHNHIRSYELQIDNGRGGEFRSIAGFDYDTKETEYIIGNLTSGVTYRLRYRVLNAVGWSTYSPVYSCLVADVPSSPNAVDLVQATATSITLRLRESLSNGGSNILNYELWMDNG